MRGGQRKHPYAVGLRSGLDARKSELICEETIVSVKDCRSVVEDKASNIKDLWL